MSCKHESDCMFFEKGPYRAQEVTHILGRPISFWYELDALQQRDMLNHDGIINELTEQRRRAELAEAELESIKCALEHWRSGFGLVGPEGGGN